MPKSALSPVPLRWDQRSVWLLSSDVTGVVTWVGTILTIAGLAITYYQAQAAKVAAERASTGVTQAKIAVKRLEERLNIADIAHISAQIDNVLQLISSDQIMNSQILFSQVKRNLNFVLLRYKSSEALESKIKRNISKIDAQLGKAISDAPKYNKSTLLRAVTGLSILVGELEKQIVVAASNGGDDR